MKQQYRLLMILSLVVCLGHQAFAQDFKEGAQGFNSTAKTKDGRKKVEKNWGLYLALTHADGFSEDLDSSTTLTGIASYRLNKRWSFFARQRIQKVYVYDRYGGMEYSWDDARFGSRYTFEKVPRFLSSLNAELHFYIPNSQLSQDLGRKGKLLARSTLKKRVFDEKLILNLQPYALYNLNSYKQSEEGDVNTAVTIGANAYMTYLASSKLSFTALAGLGQSYDELGDFQSEGRSSNNGFVDLDFSATYRAVDKLDFTLGYAHSESQIKGGTFEFYAFDPEASTWYLSTSYSL